jgi:hypothetical protein
LDSLFYWLDKIAFLVFPPLVLHFFVIFPKRKKDLKSRLSSIYILYLPALALLLAKTFIYASDIFRLSDTFILDFYQTTEKLELAHFAFFSIFAFTLLIFDTRKVSNLIIKRQLKWISYGIGIAIIPFTLFYIIPFLLGFVPSKIVELTVVFQALIPLALAYSISNYKLVNLELVLKKAAPLVFSYVVIAILYFFVSSQTDILPENRLRALIL